MLIFSEVEMIAPFPNNFKMLIIALYDRKEDPAAHIEALCVGIDFKRVSKLARCQAFPLTLSRLAQSWHNKLSFKSIVSFA